MRNTLYALLCCGLLAVPAAAGTVTVSYSTSSAGPNNYAADNFSLAGQSGTLTLNDSGTATQTINSGSYYTGDSGQFTGTEPLALSYSLTLDGVTQTVTQTASWAITTSFDTLDVAASSPVLFVTPQGNWDVTLDAFSYSSAQVFVTDPLTFQADFASTRTSTPEPASLFLVGTSMLGIGLLFRRKLSPTR